MNAFVRTPGPILGRIVKKVSVSCLIVFLSSFNLLHCNISRKEFDVNFSIVIKMLCSILNAISDIFCLSYSTFIYTVLIASKF